jgi:ABC-2 type transport system ATP-binding protein
MHAVEIRNVTKTFGAVTAVDDLSLAVPQGSVYGFIGPNGSGKTTTMRMIASIFYPDRGTIHVFGKQMLGARSELIGYLPEERGLYPRMKVRDIIVFLAALHGLTEAEAGRRADQWLDKLGLGEWKSKKLVDLSKGMQQKVQFITSVIHEPPVMILDEPFSGLDPVNSATIEEIIMEMKGKGATIVLSSHRMDQIERMCDAICLINKGQNILDGDIRSIKESYGKNTVQFEFTGPDTFLKSPSIEKLTRLGNGAEAKLKPGADSQEVLRAALQAGANITKFELMYPTLNEIFIERTTRA